MDRIEIRIMGGLGNQLYQLSAALYMKNKYSAETIIVDCGEYDTYKTRNLEIHKLIHENYFAIKNEKSIVNAFFREGYHIFQKLFRIVTKTRPQQLICGNKKKKFLCSYIECDLEKEINCDVLHLYGYFVSVQIALSVRDNLMRIIYLKEKDQSESYKEYLDLVSNNLCLAVSIRCADDYVKNEWPVCSKAYYRAGIKYVMERKGEQIPVLIFADDIQTVKKEGWFDDYNNITYVEGLTVCENFEVMRRCSHYVCSNSSFSWWGAFLTLSNEPLRINPNKIFSGNSSEVDKMTFYDGLTYMDYITGDILI